MFTAEHNRAKKPPIRPTPEHTSRGVGRGGGARRAGDARTSGMHRSRGSWMTGPQLRAMAADQSQEPDEPIPWTPGHSLPFRCVRIIGDHNAYHVGRVRDPAPGDGHLAARPHVVLHQADMKIPRLPDAMARDRASGRSSDYQPRAISRRYSLFSWSSTAGLREPAPGLSRAGTRCSAGSSPLASARHHRQPVVPYQFFAIWRRYSLFSWSWTDAAGHGRREPGLSHLAQVLAVELAHHRRAAAREDVALDDALAGRAAEVQLPDDEDAGDSCRGCRRRCGEQAGASGRPGSRRSFRRWSCHTLLVDLSEAICLTGSIFERGTPVPKFRKPLSVPYSSVRYSDRRHGPLIGCLGVIRARGQARGPARSGGARPGSGRCGSGGPPRCAGS